MQDSIADALPLHYTLYAKSVETKQKDSLIMPRLYSKKAHPFFLLVSAVTLSRLIHDCNMPDSIFF